MRTWRRGESFLLRAMGRASAASFVILWGCATGRVQPPALIGRGELDYPLQAKLAQIQGDVILALDIDEQGRVEHAAIAKSSGFPVLDDAALRYAQSLRFRPARVGRRAVRAHTELLLKFRLSQEKFDPDRWVDEVLGLQSDLRKASGERKREVLERLLEAYVAFARYAQSQRNPSLSQKASAVVSPSVRERWRSFWGVHPAGFTVLDDYLERCDDAPDLRSLAEDQLFDALLEAQRQLRLDSLTRAGDRRQREQMIAAIQSYLDTRFPSLHHQLDPVK